MRSIRTEAVRAWVDGIQERLKSRGYTLYICGGSLRDSLLGREPKDLDLVTDAPTEVIRASVPEGQFVGAHFEICLIRTKGVQAELASFRQDGPYMDGRRPLYTKPATLQEDAKRRDFTINALYRAWPEGALIDCVGGQEDLQNQVIRAVGEPLERFREDALRCLRALRFVSELGFKLDPRTKHALKLALPFLGAISVERQEGELSRLLQGEAVEAALKDMREAGLVVGPLPNPPESVPLEPNLEDWGWAVWLRESVSQARASFRYLRFSKERSKRLLLALESFQAIDRLSTKGVLQVFQSPARPLLHGLVRHFRPSFSKQWDAWQAKWEAMQQAPLCDGAMLQGLGWKPGPFFKEVLCEVRLKQFEGQLRTKEALLDWLNLKARSFPL